MVGKYTHATIDPNNPRALAVCDRCSFIVNHHTLMPQMQWSGPALRDTGLLVCPRCYDIPQEQLRTIVIPPDPVPIIDPRPGEFAGMVISSNPDAQDSIVANVFGSSIHYLTTNSSEPITDNIGIVPLPYGGYSDG